MADRSPDRDGFVLDQPGGNVALDLFVLSQHLGTMLDAAFDGSGITPSQYAVYSQLGDRTLTPGQLCETLGLRPATLSGYLAAMQRKGHVIRERSASDGRSYTLTLTEDGRRQWRRGQRRMRNAVGVLHSALGAEAEVRDARTALGALDTAVLSAHDVLRDRPEPSPPPSGN